MAFALVIAPETFAAVLLAAGMAILFALWIFYEWREASFYDNLARVSVFHCVKCGRVYSAPNRAGIAPCTNCGFANSRLKF
jgi:hypothetical protein